jgi:hypothetical protein
MEHMQARPRRRRPLVTAMAIGSVAVAIAGCSRTGGGGGGLPGGWNPTPTTMPSGDGHGGEHGGGGGDDHGGGGGGGGGGHAGHESPARLNHPPTAEQKQWAVKFVEETKRVNASRFRTKAQARAAGYNDIGDGQHFTHAKWRNDGKEMDPNYPESLVFGFGEMGKLRAAMYNMEPSTTVNNVKDYAGNWIVWHGHDNLCWQSDRPGTPGYTRLGGVVINGRCSSGFKNPAVLMVHTWMEPNKCGPFASIEGLGEGSCLPNFPND